MIILSVHNSADIYGSSRCLLRMMEPFVKDGHDVHVVVPCTGPLVGLLEEKGVKVHIHKNLAIVERTQFASFAGKVSLLWRYPVSILWLIMLILRLKVDLVHTNTGCSPHRHLLQNLRVAGTYGIFENFSLSSSPYGRYISTTCACSRRR